MSLVSFILSLKGNSTGEVGGEETLATPSMSLTVGGFSSISISWGAVTSATSYILQRATDSGFTTGLTTIFSGSGTSTADEGLSPSTTYYYRLKATAAGFIDSDYDTDSATTTSGTYSYQMTKKADVVTEFSRDGVKVVQIGSDFFCMGGWTPGFSYNDVYKSSNLVTWTRVADAGWTGRHTFGLEKMGSNIYVICGDHINTAKDCWVTTNGTSWTQLTSNLNASFGTRTIYGTWNDGTYLYVAGGQSTDLTHTAPFYDVWRSSDGTTWTQVSNDSANGFLWEVMCGGVQYFNGAVYRVCGGVYNSGTFSQRVKKSTDGGATWTTLTNFPGPGRYYHDMKVWDGKLWLVGGYDGGTGVGGNRKDIWYMDTDETWTEFTSVVGTFGERHASGVGVFNNGSIDALVICCGNFYNNCFAIEKVLS
jgi:hypothetical protein